MDQPHTRLSLDGGKAWQRPWRSSQGRSPGRWSGPEGGDPLGRDLDGEHRSLSCDPESKRGFLLAASGNYPAFRRRRLSAGKGGGEVPRGASVY